MGCTTSSDALVRSQKLERMLKGTNLEWKKEVKLLLLGPGESGKSTIFKQMKIIQDNGGYTEEELLSYKNIIYFNCLSQMRVVLEAAAFLQIQLQSQEALDEAGKLLQLPPNAPWTQEIAESIKILWMDQGIKETYELGQTRYQLNETAGYFFDRIDLFTDPNYVPTPDDILRARVRSTGIEEATFIFDSNRFLVVDVGGQRSERRKWIQCFDQVKSVIFCASISGYDQVLREDNTQNRLNEALLLFDEVTNSASFEGVDIILFLNKYDLFLEKITHVPLSVCFKNYEGGPDPEKALEFIENRFLERTINTVYVHPTTAIDTANIGHIIRDVTKTVMNAILKEITGGGV
eukprot:TRINITY_DN2634_c0_g1_i1.p1 TRINITY_DN2634_c0_g1~~TRINITY_DN2634_c0_g1_i1.p1  ORF type:complete len:349 (-),score=70.40 TRINITY_DN2634_c0_g1_i1:24-1070(-)